MQTPNLDLVVDYSLSRDRLYGSAVGEQAREELDLLRLKAQWREETWQKTIELGQIVNEELPARTDDQAEDEWGKHVIDIAINRLRRLEELRAAVESLPGSWYRIAVLKFFEEYDREMPL